MEYQSIIYISDFRLNLTIFLMMKPLFQKFNIVITFLLEWILYNNLLVRIRVRNKNHCSIDGVSQQSLCRQNRRRSRLRRDRQFCEVSVTTTDGEWFAEFCTCMYWMPYKCDANPHVPLCILYRRTVAGESPNEKCTPSTNNVSPSRCRYDHLFQCLHFSKILMLLSARLTTGQWKFLLKVIEQVVVRTLLYWS